jgi:hypothetical protein
MYWFAANYAIGVCGLASFIKTAGSGTQRVCRGREGDENQLAELKYYLKIDKKCIGLMVGSSLYAVTHFKCKA